MDFLSLQLDDVQVGEEVPVAFRTIMSVLLFDTLQTQVVKLPLVPPVAGAPLHVFANLPIQQGKPYRLFANLEGGSGAFTSNEGNLLQLPTNGTSSHIAIAANGPFLLGKINELLSDRGITSGATLLDNVNKELLNLDLGLTAGIVAYAFTFHCDSRLY